MIIVSQDKTEIINFDNVNCLYIINNIVIINIDYVGSIAIARYETEERAKEILLQIIERCASWENFKTGQLKGIGSPVYVMPEE